MSEKQFCPNCGDANRDTDSFCGSCGVSLANKQAQQPSKPVKPSYQQPTPPNYQRPMQPSYQPGPSFSPQANQQNHDPATQYMFMKKDKLGPFLLSCFCIPGAGMLMVDSDRYLGKFIISLILTFFIIGWILGIIWTLEAVDEHNRMLAYQLGVQPF